MTGRLSYRKRQLSARLYLLRRIGIRHAWRRHRLKRQGQSLAARSLQVSESMWRAAAANLGANVRRLSPVILEFELGEARALVRDQMTTSFTDRASYALARDKPASYEVLARAGVPVPEHVTLSSSDRDAARAFLARVGPPVLVKPASGGGGAGIVGNIDSTAKLERALVDVGRYHNTLLLERQVDGDSYRLLFLDGDLLDVLRKRRPCIVGDGVSSVEQLMVREYERRLAAGGEPDGYPPLEVDLDSLFALDRAGVGLRSIVPAGTSIVVKSASNFAAPDGVETLPASEVAGIIPPARVSAASLGVRLAGVDVVTVDARQALGGHGVVVEVNPVPGLMQHYHLARPSSATPVAELVLSSLLRSSG